MKLRTAALAGLLFAAGPALAQTSTPSTTPTLAPHANPGQAAPAKPAAQAPPPAEKIDPAKDAAIRHLMDITESSKMGENIANFITAQVHNGVGRALPADQLPKFMDTFSQKFTAGVPPTAVNDAIVAIYAKHFSMEDIQALTKFYESPIGQRIVKEMPEVDQQMRTAGQQIETTVALSVLRALKCAGSGHASPGSAAHYAASFHLKASRARKVARKVARQVGRVVVASTEESR
jgi:hypothetical protein